MVRAVLRTDVGLVRSENQDFGIYTTPEEERASVPGGRLMIVADGMGGHRGGATASRLAGETVKAQYLGAETDDIAQVLRDALTRANARIFSEAQSNPDLRGMGTTTSALVVRGEVGWFAHVGDSRIYLIRGGEISQLTDDHSLVASMVREGLLTTTEAEHHPRRNVLQRSMGVSEEVEIDIKGPFDVQEGDTFILCSDGLHGVVREPELGEIGKLPLERAAEEFLRLALERGAPDNVTVIVARLEREGEQEDDTLVDPTAAAFEDTQPDGVLPLVEPASASEESAGSPDPSTPAVEDAGAPRAGQDAGAPPSRDGNPVSKWMLILVLVLGAAGAWFCWNQWQELGAQSSSAPR